MLSSAEVFYEGARSCYPRALFSQIKVPPFKGKGEGEGEKEVERSRSLDRHVIYSSLLLPARAKSRRVKPRNWFTGLWIEWWSEETLVHKSYRTPGTKWTTAEKRLPAHPGTTLHLLSIDEEEDEPKRIPPTFNNQSNLFLSFLFMLVCAIHANLWNSVLFSEEWQRIIFLVQNKKY